MADPAAHDYLQLARLIFRLSRTLQRTINGPLADAFELSSNDLFVLRAVEGGTHHPSDIAGRLAVPAPSVTRSLEKLVQAGLLQRDLVASDRRRFHLSLTAEGQRVLGEARALTAQTLADAYQHVPAEVLAEAIEGLETLAEHISGAHTRKD